MILAWNNKSILGGVDPLPPPKQNAYDCSSQEVIRI